MTTLYSKNMMLNMSVTHKTSCLMLIRIMTMQNYVLGHIFLIVMQLMFNHRSCAFDINGFL